MIEIVSSGFLDSKSDVICYLEKDLEHLQAHYPRSPSYSLQILLGLGLWRSSIPHK
jgi:hypothetical protein